VSDPFRHRVSADADGTRLDRYLSVDLGWPKSLAQKAIRKGWVRVDGSRARPDTRLKPGLELRATKPGLSFEQSLAAHTPRPVIPAEILARAERSILARGDDWLVSAKPAGMVIHAGTGHDWGWVDALGAANQADFIAPIGRLDRDVSGLLLLATSRGAARRLDAALRVGDLSRTYLALVAGAPKPGLIEDRLRTKVGAPGREGTRLASPDEGQAREARTRIRPVLMLPSAGPDGASLVAVRIATGRSHQIRAHLAGRGHPIAGDPRYGGALGRRLAEALGLRRLFLHAAKLHVRDGASRCHRGPLPDALQAALRRGRRS